jgi:nicotinamidase-related amidase
MAAMGMQGSDQRAGAVRLVGPTALLVIDIQRGGAMSKSDVGIELMPGHEAFIANAERVVSSARLAGIPIIFFQEIHRANRIDIGRELDGTEEMHCVEGEVGTELWPSLQPQAGEELITKRRYSCFVGTELEILLRGLNISTLVLIGTLTDVCVHYTFADAHQRDLHVRVIDDAVLGSSLASHNAALDAMTYLQRDTRLTTAEVQSAFAWLAHLDR